MSRTVARARIRSYRNGSFVLREDVVAGEEPLEIRVGGESMAVTMRTPGHDVELVHGFLHAEGVIAGAGDVLLARYCDGVDEQGRNTYNVMDVQLSDGRRLDPARRRTVEGTSACGVCGSASIDAIAQRSRFGSPAGPRLTPEVILELPRALRAGQRHFDRTGGIHATGLASAEGTVSLVREDVGRHNAMDKVIGAALMAGELPLAEKVLVTSSRASFELVQKAVLAGCGMLVAVSAPSSLAVELARDRSLTLVGFTRDASFNVYSGAHRVVGA
ncbi:MAG: formate dehydrogenase accessory sulfurtransferase FdhD [Nakamurella sp.]